MRKLQVLVMDREASVQFSSVAQLCPTLCNPMDMQHARLPYLSPTPRVYSNSCSLSCCCHATISFSVVPFSSHLQSFPTPGPLPMSQLFASSTSTFCFDVNRGERPLRSFYTSVCVKLTYLTKRNSRPHGVSQTRIPGDNLLQNVQKSAGNV